MSEDTAMNVIRSVASALPFAGLLTPEPTQAPVPPGERAHPEISDQQSEHGSHRR